MPVKVKCKGCSAVLNAPDRARGKAIKCPKCGKGIRVPAQSASRRSRQVARQPAADDDDDFLAGMDLGRVEDRTARVCPKCGAIAGDEDVDCATCGADLVTGGMGKIQRIRSKRKGAAPAEFYSRAAGDASSYLGKKFGLVVKSSLILSIFPILTMFSTNMLVWCHNWPPKLFWLFVSAVCALFTPGWLWLVQNQFILRILEPKRERYPVRMEAFTAISLGVKSVAWSIVFGFPFWVLFGGLGGLLAMFASPVAGAFAVLAGVVLVQVIVLISWPIVQAHFAMPITWPGWMIHKVLPDVGKNLGSSLYAAVIAFGTGLVVAGVAIGAGFVTAEKQQEFRGQLVANSNVNKALQAVETAEANDEQAPEAASKIAGQEPPEIKWSLMLWPMAANIPVAIALSFWLIYNARISALFVKLFRANIENLLAHEKDYHYQVLSPMEQEALERERGPLNANSIKTFALLGVVFAALGGVIGALTIGKSLELGYVGSFGLSLLVVGSLLNMVADLLILSKAFKTSSMWGLALLAPLVNCVAFFMFIAKESKRTVYEFQLWLVSVGFFAAAAVLGGIFVAMQASAAASAKEEGAEQALRMVETLVRFLC